MQKQKSKKKALILTILNQIEKHTQYNIKI